MVLGVMDLYNEYLRIMDTYGDKRLSHYPFINSVFPMLGILALYFWFIKWQGPRMMKNRPAYDLKNIMVVYNLAQVVICVSVISVVITNLRYDALCAPYDFADHPTVPFSGYMYFLMKVLDLLDTVFFVLRKKDNQVTVLHVFHHSTMVYATWLLVKFFCSGHTPFVGLINSMVHTVMYSYYLITIFHENTKKSLWWKKYITQLQIFQFALFFLLFTPMQFMPSCPYPKGIALFVSVQNGIITILFANFYYQNYIKKKPDNGMLKQEPPMKNKSKNGH